jgi:hypothetical protein
MGALTDEVTAAACDDVQQPRRAVSAERLRVLLMGEAAEKSAPLLTLAAALKTCGHDVQFSHGIERVSTAAWLRLVWRTDVIVFIGYEGPDDFVARQLALARSVGTRLVRWWVGTDVLRCLDSSTIRERAARVGRCVDANIAVGPHLVEELRTCQIEATFIPSLVAASWLSATVACPGTLPGRVLVYLPSARREFYGHDDVRLLIEAFPQLQFVIVADDAHALAHYPNVRSLGWVDDMTPLIADTGVLLRLTAHDGLPRMVLESLLQYRHVIYAWPLQGCWHARSVDDARQALARFCASPKPNIAGRDAALQMLTPEPAGLFHEALLAAHEERGWRQRIGGLTLLTWYHTRRRTRQCLGHSPTAAQGDA